MKQEDVEKIINYWQKTAARDYDTMLGLYKIKRYPESLFYGHILLEKILKALVVQKTKNQAPYIHDLVRLQEIARLNMPKKTIIFLNKINDFNIRARYPEDKYKFYKSVDKKYTFLIIKQITELYKKLCQKLKQKK